MKRLAAVLAALLLLPGCAAERDDDRAERLQERYASMSGCTALVEAELERGEERCAYTLEIERSGTETRVTVREPEQLAGISARVGDDELLRLEFDGMVLDAGSLDENVSASNAVSIFLRAAAEGCVSERGVEDCEGCADSLRLCFKTEHGGETLMVTAWFDGDDAPIYAEIEENERILAYLRFTDFTFCDILTD
ncbi:MAG: hypothetical protein J5449_04085 [Oscillospiraceae bacterium]|nr:hypothetical protein [Oscillospiraceae bacterium]